MTMDCCFLGKASGISEESFYVVNNLLRHDDILLDFRFRVEREKPAEMAS